MKTLRFYNIDTLEVFEIPFKDSVVTSYFEYFLIERQLKIYPIKDDLFLLSEKCLTSQFITLWIETANI